MYKNVIKFTAFLTILTIIYGIIYMSLNHNKVDFLDITDDFDYWYFSLVVSTATGFGDIVPKSKIGKVLVCSQMYLFWIGVFVFMMTPFYKV